MIKCSSCGKDLAESEALIHKNSFGNKDIICKDCFKSITGIDYETFIYRRESAKQTFFAVLFCLAATIYAAATRGIEWGAIGIVLTIAVYLFASKAK